MSKGKLVPKLRFEEFKGCEWTPNKLKHIVKFSKGKGYSKNDLIDHGSPIILYGRMYTDYEVIIQDVDTYAKAKENTIYSKGTEVIVPSSGETAEDIARASFVSKKGIILGGDLNIINLIENHNPLFLALSISNGDRKKELIKRAQGSSVVHLYNTDIEEAIVYFPERNEQNKIGSFFRKIDEMIQLQQSKVNKVKDIKSAYLSEMFPKEGEKYPERRFEGFQGVWKKVRLEQVLNQSGSGGTPRTTREEYYGGDIPFLGISDITNSNGYIFNTEKTITIKGLNNSAAWIVPKESISLAMYASVGKVAILKIKSATSQAFYNMVINNQPTRDYVYQYLVKMEAENMWDRIISTGTQANLNAEKVRNLIIPMPIDIVEREKIGQFFKKLDNQILIEEEKLRKLRKLKQAYLNDMFV